ncbi:MAG: hypothetical protein IPJ65_30080 [Archangiaceae bacterium]|nr:hypothetical protein [Archangiaceae bacterium]
MSRLRCWLGLSLALSLSGCTCIFDPNRVMIAACSPLPDPAPLVAIVGDRTSVTWEWSAGTDAGPFKDWQLCWGNAVGATDTCEVFEPGKCGGDGGRCAFTLDGADAGLEFNKRVYARVVSRDLCSKQSNPATASATPINGTFLDTQGITLEAGSGCDAGLRPDGTGTMVFDEMGGLLCVSTATMGDDAWGDHTIDLEVKVQGDTLGGVVLRAPSGATSPRLGALVTASPGGNSSVIFTQRPSNKTDTPAATNRTPVAQNTWQAMRVSSRGEAVSMAVGPVGGPLAEVIRWKNPKPESLGTGHVGLVVAAFGLFGSQGHLEARNLRVRTSAEIPEGGPTSDAWSFSGPMAQHALRLVGSAALVACPSTYAAEAGCSDCLPDAGSQCLEVNGGSNFATVDVPIGVDYAKPWTMRFKFAPHATDLTVSDPSLLRTPQPAPMHTDLETFTGAALIDVAGNNWTSAPRMFKSATDTLGAPMTRGQWTRFELTFNAGAGTYSVKRNGAQVRSGAYPAELAAHLGALMLGGGGNVHGYFTDVEISQP